MCPTQVPRELITIAEAAEYCHAGERTIRRWVAEGRLIGYRLGPRFVRVDKRELENLARPIPTAGVPADVA